MSGQVSVPCATGCRVPPALSVPCRGNCGKKLQIPENFLVIPLCKECWKGASRNQRCMFCFQNHGGNQETHANSDCPARFPCSHCGTEFRILAELMIHQCSALPDCNWCGKKDSAGHLCKPREFICCCGQQIKTANAGEHIPQCPAAADFWCEILQFLQKEDAIKNTHESFNHPGDFNEGEPVPAPYYVPNNPVPNKQ